MMKATLPKSKVNENINIKHRRENGFTKGYKLFNRKQEQIADVRIYWGSSRCYAVIWVSHKGYYLSGSGFAGGYGYHKESAALSEAIQSAGIKLSERISGRGSQAMEDALKSIGKAFRYRNLHLVHVHE
jgi:hypothetical protein